MSAAAGAVSRPSPDLVPALVRMADALAWPLMLVDDRGGLRHANQAAQSLLAAGQPLRLDPQRQLQPASPSYRADFRLALQAAAAGQQRRLRWPGRPGGRSAMLRPLAPLPGGVMLLLLDLPPASGAADGLQPDLAAFARAHGLSQDQELLLQPLAQGLDAARMAAEQGLSPTTVRTRLVALRRRTGHARLDELRRALWALPPALERVADGK